MLSKIARLGVSADNGNAVPSKPALGYRTTGGVGVAQAVPTRAEPLLALGSRTVVWALPRTVRQVPSKSGSDANGTGPCLPPIGATAAGETPRDACSPTTSVVVVVFGQGPPFSRSMHPFSSAKQ